MAADFIDFYRKLISINSISSEIPEQDISNEEVIDFLNDYLTDKGFVTKKLPVKNSRNKYNLIAKIGSGAGGLALCGHTDTVPCDEGKWLSKKPEFRELLIRWFQWGCYCPVMRIHGYRKPVERVFRKDGTAGCRRRGPGER